MHYLSFFGTQGNTIVSSCVEVTDIEKDWVSDDIPRDIKQITPTRKKEEY